MGRAVRKHPQRGAGPGTASAAPDISPEESGRGGREQKDIPGGREHLINPTVPPPTAPNANPPRNQFRGILGHGVPPDGQHYDRPQGVTGRPPRPAPPPKHAPVAVPVVIVEDSDAARTIKRLFTDKFTVPSLANQPEGVRVASIDRERTFLRLLNETPVAGNPVGIRFGSLADITSGKGALLPPAMTNYLTFETHDELFATSADANTNTLSVVIETETKGVGG